MSLPPSLSLFVCPSVSVPVRACVSTYLPHSVPLSVYILLSASVSVSLSVCLSLCLCLCVSVCLSLCLCLSVCLSVCLCVCLSLCVYMSLSVSLCLPPVCICLSLSFVRYSDSSAQTSEASTLPNLLSFSLFLRAHVLTSSSGAQMSKPRHTYGGSTLARVLLHDNILSRLQF